MRELLKLDTEVIIEEGFGFSKYSISGNANKKF
jgi:hypothetical protein